MTAINYYLPSGKLEIVDVDNGYSVMLGATINGVEGIEGDCGGTLSCATCHVYVDEAWADKLPEPDDTELALLEGVAAERRPTSRLSCQLTITDELDGLVVTIPETQF